MTDDADESVEPAIRRVDADLTLDTFYDALQSVGRPLATASELARELDVSQSVALDALESLARTGRIDSADVETDPRVWFPSDYKETTDRERVVVFPGRRQVVVDGPSQFTRAQLSQFAHLEDANRESGYIYEVREEDVWSAPYDEFSGLQRTMRQALGERSDALEEWVRSQWERARKFRLYSHEDGYTVLEAKSADLMGNIAEQELEEGDLRALISDTEAWIADDAVAGVKRTLYEAGYPVLDTRHLDTGDDLPIELEVDLRDYQNEWVNRFTKKRSGILVGPPGSGKTVAAMGVMSAIEGETLVLVPGRELAAQWKETIVEHTSLSPDVIGEYHGGKKEIRPVTIATYQTAGMDRHRHLFDDRKWGLIVYDECLTGETTVETPARKTTFSQLDERYEFEQGWNDGIDEQVRTHDPGGGSEWTEVTGVYKNEAPVQRIETNTGHVLRATPSHTHLVFDPESCEIQEQRGVSEGEFLVMPLPEPDETARESDGAASAELLGWFIGDGHMNEYDDVKFSFARRADEQIRILEILCERLETDYSTFENERGDRTLWAPKLREPLGWSGQHGDKTTTVSVPDEGFGWSDSDIGALLRGLFDAEGSVDSKGRIQFNTTSEALANDVGLLLRRLGILSRSFSIEREADQHNTVHRITIPTHYNDQFTTYVGFRLEHKSSRVEAGHSPATGIPAGQYLETVKIDTGLTNEQLGEMAGIAKGTVGDTIRGAYQLGQPRLDTLAEGLNAAGTKSFEDAIAAKEFAGISYRVLGEALGVATSTAEQRLKRGERDAVQAVEELLDRRQSAMLRHSKRLSSLSELCLLEVADVQDDGVETVYDFETASHTFIANGILTHNCHHIPSPIHRRSATLQAKHRLGLSVDGETMVPIRNGGELSMRPIAEFAEEHLAVGPGMERLSGMETLGVTEDGAVEWTPIQAVMRHRHDGQMYRVRGRNGREVTVTGDHSLIVFDGETMEVTSKVAEDLSETDYLLQPEAVPAPGATDQTVDVMELLEEGYVLIDDDAPESVFDPLYERGIGDNKSRYNWKSRRSIPLSIAREIDLNRECIKGVYVHGRHSYIPPEVSTEAFARLLGLFVADGALDDGRVEFYATDSEEKSEVVAFEQVIRGVCPEVDISYVANGENCTTLRVTGPLVRVLRSLGLSNGARDKSVPSVVLSNPTAYEPFIEGIVLGDGHRAKRERGKEMVTISTSSKQLAAGLNLLLAARGYVGGEYHRNPEVGVREGDHDTVENYLVRFNPNNDGQTGRLSLTPFTEPLQRAYDEAERYGPRRADGGTFESGLAERMRLNDDELSAVTQRGDVDAEWLTETDVAMLDVESVVEVDSEDEYVYDLSTGTENFLGDHLFCHNSATPIREDDKQQEIYTLIGPPIGTNWAALFDAGYVAEPEVEIRLVPWADDDARREYDAAVGHDKRKAAAENPAKLPEIEAILREHRGEKALVFVEYIEQGEQIAEALSVPFVSGEMRHARRRKLFDEFRHGARDVLVVSRVADEGIDLPGAEIAIAASGLGGSRRQGAQRAGRTMRPVGKARMYVLATRASKEEEFARSRTRHLQGKGIRVQERGAETADESE
ncbi:hypothetical protein DM867_09820 [Halosegnis rubeus]|uniref:DNA 3'-5' helicase n=1 Tax=Halosegnis rubeus TaxID=2212850 RepID=A0A5N5U3Z1_9EURY|nr:LAGLIDADG family homing endonuclease [Halosegnis rubeus]KAB7513273.1 hypothetical protein DM867_09820 [Halosegnis rubeus]